MASTGVLSVSLMAASEVVSVFPPKHGVLDDARPLCPLEKDNHGKASASRKIMGLGWGLADVVDAVWAWVPVGFRLPLLVMGSAVFVALTVCGVMAAALRSDEILVQLRRQFYSGPAVFVAVTVAFAIHRVYKGLFSLQLGTRDNDAALMMTRLSK